VPRTAPSSFGAKLPIAAILPIVPPCRPAIQFFRGGEAQTDAREIQLAAGEEKVVVFNFDH
jgi:hypothetical protein